MYRKFDVTGNLFLHSVFFLTKHSPRTTSRKQKAGRGTVGATWPSIELCLFFRLRRPKRRCLNLNDGWTEIRVRCAWFCVGTAGPFSGRGSWTRQDDAPAPWMHTHCTARWPPTGAVALRSLRSLFGSAWRWRPALKLVDVTLPVFRSQLGCPDSGTVGTVLVSGAL
jgi:hypothetical protein